MTLHLQSLNHGSTLLERGPLRLLCDPWFSGSTYQGGCALRYHNPEAVARAASATHLWISSRQSDHFHPATLRALARIRPDLLVLANDSANGSMVDELSSMGFGRILPLAERTWLRLDAETEIIRYPVGASKNMLLVESGDYRVLHFNDCAMSGAAFRLYRRELGAVDLLIAEASRSGKEMSFRPAAALALASWQRLGSLVDVLDPARAVVLPAELNYRCPASQEQNGVLCTEALEAEAEGDSRFVVLRVGDSCEFDPSLWPQHHPRFPAVGAQPVETLDYGPSVAWELLLAEAEAHAAALATRYPFMSRAVPTLRVYVEDLDRTLALSLTSGVGESATHMAHVAAHSKAVYRWLSEADGAESFWAGAHFSLRMRDSYPIRRWLALARLGARQLDLRSVVDHVRSPAGRRFLWNRRVSVLGGIAGLRGR